MSFARANWTSWAETGRFRHATGTLPCLLHSAFLHHHHLLLTASTGRPPSHREGLPGMDTARTPPGVGHATSPPPPPTPHPHTATYTLPPHPHRPHCLLLPRRTPHAHCFLPLHMGQCQSLQGRKAVPSHCYPCSAAWLPTPYSHLPISPAGPLTHPHTLAPLLTWFTTICLCCLHITLQCGWAFAYHNCCTLRLPFSMPHPAPSLPSTHHHTYLHPRVRTWGSPAKTRCWRTPGRCFVPVCRRPAARTCSPHWVPDST